MTDEELDSLLIEILNEYLAETKQDAEYIKNQKSKDYKEVKEDYHFVIEHLTNLLPNIHSLDDLAEMDEEDISLVYDYIAEYAGNFIIREDPRYKEADLKKYSGIEEILNMFMDDDDFDEEEEI